MNERGDGGRQFVYGPDQVSADVTALLRTAADHRFRSPDLHLGFLHHSQQLI